MINAGCVETERISDSKRKIPKNPCSISIFILDTYNFYNTHGVDVLTWNGRSTRESSLTRISTSIRRHNWGLCSYSRIVFLDRNANPLFDYEEAETISQVTLAGCSIVCQYSSRSMLLLRDILCLAKIPSAQESKRNLTNTHFLRSLTAIESSMSPETSSSGFWLYCSAPTLPSMEISVGTIRQFPGTEQEQ